MSIAERKEREKELRRNSIIDAAEGLFFSRGYDNVTMDDIARAVELNKATIYIYFKNKDSLFFAVVLRGVRILNGMVKESEKNADTGFKKLWGIGHSYLSFAKKYPDYNRVYNYFYSGRFDLENSTNFEDIIEGYFQGTGTRFWEIVSLAGHGNNEYLKEIIRLNYEIFSLIYNAIKSGVEDGHFRPELDITESAVTFTLLIENIPKIRPDLRKVLDNGGIDQSRFSRYIGESIGHMLIKKEHINTDLSMSI